MNHCMSKLENCTSQYCGVLLTSLRLAWEPHGELPDRKLRRLSQTFLLSGGMGKLNSISILSSLQFAFHFIRRVCCCLFHFRINALQLPA